LIVGDGAGAESARAAACELSNVSYLPFQPRERLSELYASADVGLALLRPGMARTSMPSKLYSIMAAGRPVVASVDVGSEAWRLIERVGCGICVPPGDAGALALALDDVQEEGYRARGERGRRYVEQYHTRGAVGHAYDQLLAQLSINRTTRFKRTLAPADSWSTSTTAKESADPHPSAMVR
jgi:colanic acid biosynthesis glycosyl transferase WcaI